MAAPATLPYATAADIGEDALHIIKSQMAKK
jgi:hypothetical protein